MQPARFHSLDLVASLLVALFVLISCTALQPEAPAGPFAPVAQTPAVTPTRGAATLSAGAVADGDEARAKGCIAGDAEAVFTDPAGTYCFAFPAGLMLTGAEGDAVSLVGPPLTAGPEALFVSLGIERTPASPIELSTPDSASATLSTSGRAATEPDKVDLNAAADAALAGYSGFTAWEITRTDATLGGEPALRVEPVPGTLSSRVLFVQHDDQLYRLSFWPADEGAASPDLETLFTTVTESFRFLAPVDAAPQDQAGATITGRVMHGDQPIVGAIVALRLPDWRTNGGAVVMETLSSADGAYALVGVPAGAYEVVPAWPTGEQSDAPPAAGTPIVVGNGVSAATANLALATALRVTAPAPGDLVSPNPTLAWEAVAGARAYRVVVMGDGSAAAPFAGNVTGTALAIEPPLEPGDYVVVINALGANGTLLAEGHTAFSVGE